MPSHYARGSPVVRHAGYAPIRDYAAIGDGRTVALVARDGSVDWLCLPNLDSPSVLGALLDAEGGGSFALAPETAYTAARRYVPGTNVLETTFYTDDGAVRVTDAMTLGGEGLGSFRELARRIEGLAGRVPMRWRLDPRFGYGGWVTRIEERASVPVALAHTDAIAVLAWDAGTPACDARGIEGRFEARAGARSLLAVEAAHQEPLVFPPRGAVEARLDATAAFWRRWSGSLEFDGPWREQVVRSALVLKLLVYAPSGAIAAAPTTSLPEVPGGERNWDYRFCWIRDSSFALDALLRLGCDGEAHAFFWWFMHATQLTHPRLQVLYRLDGGARAPERAIALAGYRGSRPVRIGNAAAGQHQLDVFGDLFETAWLYADEGHPIDRDTGRALAEVADHVCAVWRKPDTGIWEVRLGPRHFTQSKMMCWVALDRAIALAEAGRLPRDRVERWRREAPRIRRFIDTCCWSERRGSYAWFAGSDTLDASLLHLALVRYAGRRDARVRATLDAIRRDLTRGRLVYRYDGDDGLPGEEATFLACAFWLAHALAVAGRLDEAAQQMEGLFGLANDVGLYAEEMDAASGEHLGNFPQGLVHLALVNAAVAFGAEERRARAAGDHLNLVGAGL